MNLISLNDLEWGDISDLFYFPEHIDQSGKIAIMMFGEPSTRTRISFEMAALSNNINPIIITRDSSSIAKGESLLDTFTTLREYNPDFLIVRHKNGTVCQLAESIFDKKTSIVSAGTGTTNHPTQALGDALLIESLKGNYPYHIGVVGDIVYSRVAQSFIQICKRMGWKLTLFGPPELTPSHGMNDDLPIFHDLKNLRDMDFIYVLRPQLERYESDLFNKDDFISHWRIEGRHIREGQFVLHAGPAIRGLEITSDVLDSPICLARDQVRSCLTIRKKLFGWLGSKQSG